MTTNARDALGSVGRVHLFLEYLKEHRDQAVKEMAAGVDLHVIMRAQGKFNLLERLIADTEAATGLR